MGLKILCSGFLVRYPVGGLTWHHLHYLLGFQRLGHDVFFFEDYGWTDSCYDLRRDQMTADPSYGVEYVRALLERHGLGNNWCYLAEDGTAYGMSRDELTQLCRECDVYFNLDNINWIPELELCQRRVLVDADPVFTQIGGHGLGGPFARYHRLFTYGENIHRAGCDVPTGGVRWLPTRQPIALDMWPTDVGEPAGPLTTVMNWSAYGDREYGGRVYGQKDREFPPYVSLPRDTGELMEVALSGASDAVHEQLLQGGWRIADAREVSRDVWSYQGYLGASRAEFSVAKHGYVITRSGWFSDRSAGYLARGRPVIVQDTGFSDFLPCGTGLLAFRTRDEAAGAIGRLHADYATHCRAARAIAEEYFDARRVLGDLLTRSL